MAFIMRHVNITQVVTMIVCGFATLFAGWTSATEIILRNGFETSNPLTLCASLAYEVHQFAETEFVPQPPGDPEPPTLVYWQVSATYRLDLNSDGVRDTVVPITRGYGSGADTRARFAAFTTNNGLLEFDPDLNEQMPFVAGARKSDHIVLAPENIPGVVTVATETGDGRLADMTLLTQGLTIDGLDRIPPLPQSREDRDHAVSAHSLTVGDFDGDGDDDMVVGEWEHPQGPFFLWQQADGDFSLGYADLLGEIANGRWPLVNPTGGEGFNLLLELRAADVDRDGDDDLVVGWGHGSARAAVFFSDDGIYDKDNRIDLPASVYGVDNQLHLETFPSDLDGDGDLDLVIQWTRFDPYYAGNYIQILRNDLPSGFVDVSASAVPAQPDVAENTFGTGEYQVIDLNNDGKPDIAGQRADGPLRKPFILVNTSDTTIQFTAVEPEVDEIIQNIVIWGNLTGGSKLEFLTLDDSGVIENGTKTLWTFSLFEVEGFD